VLLKCECSLRQAACGWHVWSGSAFQAARCRRSCRTAALLPDRSCSQASRLACALTSHAAPAACCLSLSPQDCNADAGSADYEQWQVSAPGACLLGEQYSMVRRKRDAGCFNTPSYVLNVTRSGTCNCTLADTGTCWRVHAGGSGGPSCGRCCGGGRAPPALGRYVLPMCSLPMAGLEPPLVANGCREVIAKLTTPPQSAHCRRMRVRVPAQRQRLRAHARPYRRRLRGAPGSACCCFSTLVARQTARAPSPPPGLSSCQAH
jgi:hypothetical protein